MEGRKQQERTIRHLVGSRTALGSVVVAVALLFGSTALSTAQAQSTVARIFGVAPAGAQVIARNDTGARRRTTVRNDGHYVLRSLPLGTYTVTLEKGGKVADTVHHVPLTVSRGMEVDFACPHDQCAAPSGGSHSR